jgi:transcriptional regulator GlxA family with amidase domain
MAPRGRPLEILVLALLESAGSVLYGLVDVLNSAGRHWHTLVRDAPVAAPLRVRVVAVKRRAFRCGNNVPVAPDVAIRDDPAADIVIIPELWLGPDEHLAGRHTEVQAWLRERYRRGAYIYSVCSASLLLAEAGLLDGCNATSHWGYQHLFEERYPRVRFRPEPNLCFADADGRLVTSGGATSWHDLILHVIARHIGPGEALRISKVYLFKTHDEGQLPYRALIRRRQHPDSVVRECESWLGKHFAESGAVAGVVRHARVAERTLKRRFKAATGLTLIDYLQNLRIEKAKELLETSVVAVDDISATVGYEDASFFRRLFKRRSGLSPARYRRMFQPIHGSAHRAA